MGIGTWLQQHFWEKCDPPEWIKIPRHKCNFYIMGKTFIYHINKHVGHDWEHMCQGNSSGRWETINCYRRLRKDK
jgi:hypothetical protein